MSVSEQELHMVAVVPTEGHAVTATVQKHDQLEALTNEARSNLDETKTYVKDAVEYFLKAVVAARKLPRGEYADLGLEYLRTGLEDMQRSNPSR
jgi:hypothetical protein